MAFTQFIYLWASAVLLTTLLNGFCTFQLYRNISVPAQIYSYIGDDFPSELPLPFDTGDVALRFEGDDYYITSDAEWASLVPPNHGRVRLGPQSREFDVGMYQQLHCLNSVRLAYLAVHGSPSPIYSPDFPEAESCLDTLRQAVLCNADITVVPAHEVVHEDGSTSSSITGIGVDHRCRDWTQVRSVVERNQETSLL